MGKYDSANVRHEELARKSNHQPAQAGNGGGARLLKKMALERISFGTCGLDKNGESDNVVKSVWRTIV